MKIRHGIAGRIQRVFLMFALLTSLLFSMLILGYSWIVEDNIFNRLVEREAAFIAAQHAATGMVVQPRPPFMTLYESWDDLPEPIGRQRRADPNRIEFEGGPEGEGTIHTREIVLGTKVLVLAANVSGYEVSRDYLPVVSLWLLAGVGLICVLAAWAAWLTARSAVLPLRRLADAIATVEHREMEPGFAAAFPDNEVGFLAQTIETNILRLQSVLRRETDFTRDVSHELRTPAAVLALLTNELESEQGLSTQSRQLFKHTVIELEQTISTLLALARQENIETEEIALLPILEESIINHFQLSRDEDFNLQIDVPDDMKAVCNPHLAKILFDNLLTNAARYASEPWLRIKANAAGLIFENATESVDPAASKGMGLGLNLVKRVCDRFHWRVAVEREARVFRIKVHIPTPLAK